VGDAVRRVAFVLHPPGDADHARGHDGGAVSLEAFRPDDEVGDGVLVLDGHEYDAARRARALAHQH